MVPDTVRRRRRGGGEVHARDVAPRISRNAVYLQEVRQLDHPARAPATATASHRQQRRSSTRSSTCEIAGTSQGHRSTTGSDQICPTDSSSPRSDLPPPGGAVHDAPLLRRDQPRVAASTSWTGLRRGHHDRRRPVLPDRTSRSRGRRPHGPRRPSSVRRRPATPTADGDRGRPAPAATRSTPRFGTGGITTSAFTESAFANAVVAQPDGKLVVVGAVRRSPERYDWYLERFSANGAIDTSFNGTGRLVLSTDGHPERRDEGGRRGVTARSTSSARASSSAPNDADSRAEPGLQHGQRARAVDLRRISGSVRTFGQDLQIMNDGKVLVAGSTTSARRGLAAVRRALHRNGRPGHHVQQRLRHLGRHGRAVRQRARSARGRP